MKYNAITLQSPVGKFFEIITDVGVSPPIRPGFFQEIQSTYWTKCLWDTGATHSMITKETAEIFGLESIGDVRLVSAQGEGITKVYKVGLNLPNLMVLPALKVTECTTNDGFGVVIGMDVISMGDFAITNVAGIATFSFCIPGIATIDYQASIAALGKSADGTFNS